MRKKVFTGTFTTALLGIANNSVLINRCVDAQTVGDFQNGTLLNTEKRERTDKYIGRDGSHKYEVALKEPDKK